MTDTLDEVTVSLVVPVYSGEAYLEALVAAAESLREGWRAAGAPITLSEMVLVDDAAIDGSGDLIDALAARHAWIVPVHLSRNFGQHASTAAGILHSSGDWIVTLDEDLQHPPAKVPALLQHAVTRGLDVVYAQPAEGPHQAAWRDTSSRGFKRVMSWLTGNAHLRLFNSFRLIRGPIARAAASVSGHDTYFDIGLSWFTERVEAIEMALTDARFAETGKSGYTLKSLFNHALRMLFSSQIRFLSLGILLGIVLFFVSFSGGIFYLLRKLIAPETIAVEGWTSLFLLICFSAGLLAFMLGITLKYLSTLVLKAHGKPLFFTIDRSRDVQLAAWFSQTAEKAA